MLLKPLVRSMIKNRVSDQKYQHCLAVVMLAMLSGNAPACDGLLFSDAWIREPPPVASVAAAYVSVTNETNQDITITHFESACCGHVMAHETIVQDNKSKMEHLSTLIIPARQTVRLEPLGKHLMLMKPRYALTHGDSAVMTFTCSPEQSSTVDMPIVKQ